MESTKASWVSMIMDRLHALEHENDRLKRELDSRCPPSALSPNSNITIHDTSGKQSTYFKIAVFTDRPGLHDLLDFGRALFHLDHAPFCDVALRSVSWSEVWNERPLKRNIVYMTGIIDCSSAQQVIAALQRAWGDSVTPESMSGADVYSDAQAGQVYLGNWVQLTSYHTVWCSLLGWGDNAILLDLGSNEIRTRDECIWDDFAAHDPLGKRAMLWSACGIDQIELYGEADELLQCLLSGPVYVNSD